MDPANLTCKYLGCSRVYSNDFNLKRHIESYHLCLKKFICEICHKGLSSKQNMREHHFIHQGVKPYLCAAPGCGSSFRQLSQLKLHKKFHKEVSRRLESQQQIFSVDFSIFSKPLSAISLGKPASDQVSQVLGSEPESRKNFFELGKILNSDKT